MRNYIKPLTLITGSVGTYQCQGVIHQMALVLIQALSTAQKKGALVRVGTVLLLLLLFSFYGLTYSIQKFPRLGVKSELQLQLLQGQIQAASVTYDAACSNAESFPISQSRDPTIILRDNVRSLALLATMRTPCEGLWKLHAFMVQNGQCRGALKP